MERASNKPGRSPPDGIEKEDNERPIGQGVRGSESNI